MKKTLLLGLLAGLAFSLHANEFVPLDRVQARQLVDVSTHKKPTVVALWSTECSHCKKNLKLFRRLAQEEPSLVVVTVVTEPVSPAVMAQLEVLPTPHRFAYGNDMPEALAFSLDSTWHGELPRTLLFDGQGHRKAISGVLDEKTVREALLLSRKK